MSRVMAALLDVARHFRSAAGVRLPGGLELPRFCRQFCVLVL